MSHEKRSHAKAQRRKGTVASDLCAFAPLREVCQRLHIFVQAEWLGVTRAADRVFRGVPRRLSI
ncbi:MAG: hypothetical protein ACM3U2_04235, partial [Deltaproteobacteria bacterium]